MTTTVKVEAHCASSKEVVVEIQDGEFGHTAVLQDGERSEHYAYDARKIVVYERPKTTG